MLASLVLPTSLQTPQNIFYNTSWAKNLHTSRSFTAGEEDSVQGRLTSVVYFVTTNVFEVNGNHPKRDWVLPVDPSRRVEGLQETCEKWSHFSGGP